MSRRPCHYNVAPRYTPGSPAMVNQEIAERVAAQEKSSIQHALEGTWGPEEQARAERLGLRGIVEFREERGSGKKYGWEVTDLCTGERFFRLCTESLLKLGWKRFADFPPWAQREIETHAPNDIESWREKAWFKVEEEIRSGFFAGLQVKVYRPEPLETAA